MTNVLDTNILVLAVRNSSIWNDLVNDYQLSDENILISVVSVGELYSLADQFGWGQAKLNRIQEVISKTKIVAISEEMIDAYRAIDTYSQNAHKTLRMPAGMSARNMGKNDIWIAATAYTTKSRLFTCDKDFLHLETVFLEMVTVEMK
ncbi:MAG: PIN domain-containing protein [Bacteroidetes bacterium]|nr:MAG: PIN domain-containing protein [Bacteroidota bacterium]